MNIDQRDLLLILAAIALAYGVIRFVLLPWLVPRFADRGGKKSLGAGDEKVRADGGSIDDTFADGKLVQREQRDHALSRETDVPIEVIHAFRRDHSQMSLQAERLPVDAGGERFRVIGTNPDKDGYSSDYVAMDYRADGTRIEDANDDTGRYERLVESVAWERLPEKIRHAASAAVPGAIFAEAFASDAEEAHYEVHLSTTRDRWVVEIDSDGRVRQTRKRDT